MGRIICATCLMLLLATPFTVAQETKPEEKDKKTHDEIIALREAFLKAIEKKDADAVIALTHPEIVITVQDGKELKTIRKHDRVKDYLTRHLTGPSPNIKSLTPKDVEVDARTILYGDDTGVAFGSSKDEYVMADGREFTLPTRWSATLVKTPDGWKIANLHVANDLFDNPVLDAYKKSMTWFLIGAGVAGLVVGWVLAKLMAK